MRNFFDNIPLDNQEISDEQIKKIKASVLSRVKEEKAMSKRTTIKTITIAIAAATTAALSAMIASAEQPAATPATDVDYTIEETGGEAAETETGELPGEAAFKEYIEKAKAEDVGAPEKAPETVNGWIAVDADTGDLVCVQPINDVWTGYYYYRGDDEQLQEMLDNGWALVDTEINTIHLNEVFVDD